MRTSRILIVALVAVMALILPFSETGTIGIHLIAPAALGAIVAQLFSERSILVRTLILYLWVIGVAVVRISWDAMVLNNGDWRFDGEIDLVLMSVVIQSIVAALAFVGGCIVLRTKPPIA